MKLIEDLIARAAECDAAMGELANNEEARMARQAVYKDLERAFEAMADDGYLDAKEIQSLLAQFRAAGLDTGMLDDLAKDIAGSDKTSRVEVGAKLRNAITDMLNDAEIQDRDIHFGFKAQSAMSEYQQAIDAASRASKAENEIYMTAIRHLVA